MVRAALRRLNAHLSRRQESINSRGPSGKSSSAPASDEALAALRGVFPEGPDAKAYFEKHLTRLARTLTLIPRAPEGGCALELGCYMQITPLLKPLRGYTEVRGAAYGTPGTSVLKTAVMRDSVFHCEIDLFDVEKDRFPYSDGHFDLVLACELIEHMLADPMHLLLECRRVLKDGGKLLLSTPNVGSLTSVWRALHGYDNPQIYYQYSRPREGKPPETPHVREYTAFELANAVRSAGFEVELLITEPIAELAEHQPMWNFLEEHGFNTSHRGEQTYCIAVKKATLAVDRYPRFLYTD
jgi:SAM-dependent methyltransferase